MTVWNWPGSRESHGEEKEAGVGAGPALGKSGERAAAALLDNLSTDSLDFKVLAAPKKQVPK